MAQRELASDPGTNRIGHFLRRLRGARHTDAAQADVLEGSAYAGQNDTGAGGIQSPVPSVRVHEGVYSLEVGPGLVFPFLQHDAPLRELGEGWRFRSLHTLFAPLLLMELEHEAGHRATWFFDSTPKFVAHLAAALPPVYRAIVLQRVARVLPLILSPVLGAAAAAAPDALPDFFALHETTRVQLGALYNEVFLPPPQLALPQHLPDCLPVLSGQPSAVIARNALQRAVSEDFQDRLIAAVRDGYLSWPGLRGGSDLPCSASLCLNDFLFAYRFQDVASALVFFVIATGHKASCVGIYLPSEGLLVGKDEPSLATVCAALPNAGAAIAEYACRYGDALAGYIALPGVRPMACSMRESHIGHQVWNELSGLEALVRAVPTSPMPLLLPFGGAKHAFFGPFESLFPEFAGRTRPDLQTSRDVIAHSHHAGVVLARFTRNYVSAGLRSRILNQVRRTEDFRIAQQRRRQAPGPVILIGLRVENRTAIGLPSFLIALVRCIAEVLPGSLIVFDGQNAASDDGRQASASFASHLAARSPVAVELDICNQVRAAIDPAHTLVEVASGQSIATSIAWADLAAGFIGFWGAGFAKYRWIANKPGLVLSNRNNLQERPDLHIYSSPEFMEDPAPITFVDPSCIHDDLDAPQLIAIREPSFANFTIDEAQFFAQVRSFLAQFRAALAVQGRVPATAGQDSP